MHPGSIHRAIVVGLILVRVTLLAWAQQEATTDVSTLDRTSAERAYQI